LSVDSSTPECAYSDEATYRGAPAKAVAEPKMRLRRAVADAEVSQALRALKELGVVESTFNRYYWAVRGSWLHTSS